MKLSYSEFIELYEPIDGPEGNHLWETYGEDMKRVMETDDRYVWTVKNGDYVTPGETFVDRSNYIITKKPWEIRDMTIPLGNEYVVFMSKDGRSFCNEITAGDRQHAKQLAVMFNPLANVIAIYGPYWEAE